MWKYKEFLIFPELRGFNEGGELGLVRVILHENPMLAKSTNFQRFIEKLYERCTESLSPNILPIILVISLYCIYSFRIFFIYKIYIL